MAKKKNRSIQPVSAPAPATSPLPAASPAPATSPKADLAATSLPSLASSAQNITAEPPAWFVSIDRVQIVLLLIVAFFLGSFAATNSDVWLYRGIGRLIAQGEWTIGVDPFSFATEATRDHDSVFWVNHSWLYSWLFYVLHAVIGGAGLVFLKALAVVGVVMCMLSIREPATNRLLSLVVIGLATLALGPGVLLQPTMASMLLLGITLVLLHRGGALGDRPANPRLLWWLPVLFAAWANLDVWFILGPLTLGLLWAGMGVGACLGLKNGVAGKTLGLIFGASLVACLANPHHVRIFQLPTDLAYLLVRIVNLPDFLVAGGRAAQILERTEIYPLHSPFTWGYLSNPGLGANVAGVAYYPLLLMGAVSFIAVASLAKKPSAPVLHPGRILLWLVLALLSAVQSRFIPFFAIAAGPVAVLNLTPYLARNASIALNMQVSNWRPAKLIRALTLLVLLGLIYLAWPGWIVGAAGDFQAASRVDWSVPADPSLQRAAEKLAALHQAGQSPRVFNFSPDLANYCAWFAPGVKCFLDSRLALFPQEAFPYARARKAMWDDADLTVGDFHKGSPQQIQRQLSEARNFWGNTFRKHRIDHVALADMQPRLLYKLWVSPQHWTQEYADDRTLVFAWSEQQKTPPADTLEAETTRRAFGVVAVEERAPEHGAIFSAVDSSFWRQYFAKQSLPPLALSEGNFWGTYHQTMANRWQLPFLQAQFSVAGSSSAGDTAVAAFAIPSLLQLYREVYPSMSVVPSGRPFLRAQDYGPPGAPLLMVRALRRAVRENPDYPGVYLALATAYKILWHEQEEVWANYLGSNAVGLLSRVRQIQILTALRTYLQHHSDDAKIHEDMAANFEGEYFLDLALDHWRQAAQLVENSPRKLQDTDSFQKRRDFLQSKVKYLDAVVKERREAYRAKVAFLPEVDLDRYRWALRLPYQTVDRNNQPVIDPRGYGLALDALAALEKLTESFQMLADDHKAEVMGWQLWLHVQMGLATEVTAVLQKGDQRLGPKHHELQALVAAALGDYAQFEKSLRALEKSRQPAWALRTAGGVAAYVAGLALANHYPLNCSHGMLVQTFEEFDRQAAEFRSLRGLMALEQGDTVRAKTLFKDTLLNADPHTPFPNRPIVERYLQLLGN